MNFLFYQYTALSSRAVEGIPLTLSLPVFENYIIHKFGSFCITPDNQFGFKRGLGCNYAIRAVRNIVDGYMAEQLIFVL